MNVLYVLHEHPSVSQSFVVNEAAAVSGLGPKVLGYALKRGGAGLPAAELDLIETPPTKARLATVATTDIRAGLSAVRRARGPLRGSEAARLILAEAHAAHALSGASAGRINHIHAHFLGRTSDVASALARRIGCRWTATAHGNDVYAPGEPGLLRMRLRGAAAIACASEDVRRHVLRHAKTVGIRVETRVVRCGINASAFEFTPRDPAATPHVVSVGRLVETKGYVTALAAMKTLMVDNDDLRWTIVGDGPLRNRLEVDVANAQLDHRIAFAGALDHREIAPLLTGSTVFLLPCLRGPDGESDGIPVALMEAMAIGVPVVTSPVGGISELVSDGETGYLATPGDTEALVSTLCRALNPALENERHAISRAAREKVARDFEQSREAQELISVFEDMTV